MSDHIPPEIITKILVRLPVISLLRFTKVCKLWYSIITNPTFIITHLNRFGDTTTDQLLFRLYTNNDRKEHYFLRLDDEKFNKNSIELEFPFKSSVGYFRIVGSCKGLVCLWDDRFQYAENVIVWNPCIRKSVTLTLPEKPPNPYTCVIGFGFVLGKNVFKVVRIVYEKECLNKRKVPQEVHVYEQGGREWRGIGCAPMVEFMWSQVFLHGAVHWVAYDPSEESGFRNLIVCFDMGDEVFKEIALPPILAKQKTSCLSVAQLKNSLVVLCTGRSGECSVWEMRDYGSFESWTSLYYILSPAMLGGVLGFRKNNEILITSDTGVVISYDPGTGITTNTGIQGSLFSLKVHNFVESLILLKEGSDVPG